MYLSSVYQVLFRVFLPPLNSIPRQGQLHGCTTYAVASGPMLCLMTFCHCLAILNNVIFELVFGKLGLMGLWSVHLSRKDSPHRLSTLHSHPVTCGIYEAP